ncbi:MAG TPA: HAMP domain-containing sensor histidine kinase [Polyangiaceae bacterium]|nr:HAMP domain-containing sensor histidine kinase [Polyangiaceae bacterium]
MSEQFSVLAVHPLASSQALSLSSATCHVRAVRSPEQLMDACSTDEYDAVMVVPSELSWCLAELGRAQVRTPVLLALDVPVWPADACAALPRAVNWTQPESWIAALRALRAERVAERREELDARIRRTEKLRLFSELSSNMAHDLNNLVNPLSLFLDLLEREISASNQERALAHVSALRKVAQRCLEHVEGLRRVARPTLQRELDEVSLPAVVEDALLLTQRRLLTAAVKVSREDAGEAVVRAHHEDLVLSVVHLLENAIDAAGPGSTIQIRTGCDADERWLEIRDSGAGMNEESSRAALEPLFTTKKHGAGLGLNFVQWIAKRYLGTMNLESAPERGTRVRLSFEAPC